MPHHIWCRANPNNHTTGACDCAWLNQGTEQSSYEFVVHRGGFAVKDYKVPSKKPRGFWHGDNPLDDVKWAWCPVVDGVVMASQSRGGFATRKAAIDAALGMY
jgi:hypothetical protein